MCLRTSSNFVFWVGVSLILPADLCLNITARLYRTLTFQVFLCSSVGWCSSPTTTPMAETSTRINSLTYSRWRTQTPCECSSKYYFHVPGGKYEVVYINSSPPSPSPAIPSSTSQLLYSQQRGVLHLRDLLRCAGLSLQHCGKAFDHYPKKLYKPAT